MGGLGIGVDWDLSGNVDFQLESNIEAEIDGSINVKASLLNHDILDQNFTPELNDFEPIKSNAMISNTFKVDNIDQVEKRINSLAAYVFTVIGSLIGVVALLLIFFRSIKWWHYAILLFSLAAAGGLAAGVFLGMDGANVFGLELNSLDIVFDLDKTNQAGQEIQQVVELYPELTDLEIGGIDPIKMMPTNKEEIVTLPMETPADPWVGTAIGFPVVAGTAAFMWKHLGTPDTESNIPKTKVKSDHETVRTSLLSASERAGKRRLRRL